MKNPFIQHGSVDVAKNSQYVNLSVSVERRMGQVMALHECSLV
jgi:hypothetical protein